MYQVVSQWIRLLPDAIYTIVYTRLSVDVSREFLSVHLVYNKWQKIGYTRNEMIVVNSKVSRISHFPLLSFAMCVFCVCMCVCSYVWVLVCTFVRLYVFLMYMRFCGRVQPRTSSGEFLGCFVYSHFPLTDCIWWRRIPFLLLRTPVFSVFYEGQLFCGLLHLLHYVIRFLSLDNICYFLFDYP